VRTKLLKQLLESGDTLPHDRQFCVILDHDVISTIPRLRPSLRVCQKPRDPGHLRWLTLDDDGITGEAMTIAFELSEAQAEKLRQLADRLGIPPVELAKAAVAELLATRDEDSRAALERVLQKNAELYKRLA